MSQKDCNLSFIEEAFNIEIRDDINDITTAQLQETVETIGPSKFLNDGIYLE